MYFKKRWELDNTYIDLPVTLNMPPAPLIVDFMTKRGCSAIRRVQQTIVTKVTIKVKGPEIGYKRE